MVGVFGQHRGLSVPEREGEDQDTDQGQDGEEDELQTSHGHSGAGFEIIRSEVVRIPGMGTSWGLR